MKVYLAGPSKEIPRVKAWAERLEEAGHVITYKWWADVEKHGPGNDGGLSDAEQSKYAYADLDGVLAADVVWCLWPEGGSMGTAVELGYALGINEAYVVVTGPRAQACIFASLAELRSANDEDGFAFVCSRSKGSAAP